MAPEAITLPSRVNATLKGAPDCKSARCGMDAGCRKEADGSWICICTHDLSPPRPDGSCPRFVVKDTHPPSNKKTFITIRRTAEKDQKQPFPIHPSVAPPPTGQNLPSLSNELDPSSSSASVLVWMLPLFGVLIALGASLWLKRQWRLRKSRRAAGRDSCERGDVLQSGDHHHHHPKSAIQQAEMPVCLTKNVLDQERFMANPEYDWNADQAFDPLTNEAAQLLARSQMLTAEQLRCFHLISPEWIELQQEIGEGCFGKVFRGLLKSERADESEDVAVKVLKAAAGPTAQEDLIQEAEIMASFYHPNILALKGIVINGLDVGPWLVFEYMALGDLAQLLRAANGNNLYTAKTKTPQYSLDQEDLHSIAEQIADGMAYLSSQHFVHRDLACRNCLVGEKPGNGGLAVKISDFGMSRDVYTSDYYKIGGSRMLPVRWMSPESILYGKFTLESDVWSYGVVLWEIFALGVQPYYGHSNEQVVKLILQGILLTPPDLAPPLICQLLNGCWKTQPSDRLTFAEILSRLKQTGPFKKGGSMSSGSSSPQTVTYVHLRHEKQPCDEYLQTLPDLPVHIYSNA